MATYVKNKSGAFKKAGDQTEMPTKQRSEARMKSYTSATDARAWVNNMCENKQYIIDLMGTETPKQTNQIGKFVPVDVLVKALLGNKDVDIDRLKMIIKELDAFVNTLKLNTKEMAAFNKIRALYAAGDATPVPRGRKAMPLTESTYGRTSSEVRARETISDASPRTSSESRLYSPRETVMPTSASEAGSGQPGQHPLHVQHTPRPRSRPRTPVHYSGVNKLLSHRQETRQESDSQSSRKTSSSSPIRYPSVYVESSHKDVQVGQSVDSVESQTQTVLKPKELVHQAQQCLPEVVPLRSKSSTSSLKSKIPVLGPTGDVKCKLTQTPVVSCHDIQTCSDQVHVDKCGDCERNMKTAHETLDELEATKKVLDDRNYKLQMTEKQLMKLQDELVDKEHIDEDIASMAAEIANLRKTGCKDELKIVSTELQLLKKYCQKLIYIKAENTKLKQENDNLLNIRCKATKSVPCLREHHQQLVNICANTNVRRLPSSVSDNDLRNKLQAKTTTLKEVSKQRDKLQSVVAKLEAKLKKYDILNEDINGLKERSKILDSVIEEKLGLERRLQRLSSLEDEMISLKMRAEKAEELQRALENAQNKLLRLQERRNEQLNPVQVIENASNVAALLEDLRYKTREAEVLRVDRDRMRVRLEELSHIDHQYKILQGKVRMLEVVQNERDIYKTKTMELSSIQDDYVSMREQVDQVQRLTEERDAMMSKMSNLECVIGDQENEISRLVMHVERLSKGADQHQDKIKEIISELRSEIEIKNLIISNSETQLADVQTQLKQTIDVLTMETSSLKQKVAQADISCQVLKTRLERLGKQLTDATVALEKEKKTCYRYKAEVISLTEENAKLQEIAERMNDLTDSGKLESILRKSHAALQHAANKLTNYDRSPDRSIYTDISTNTRPFVGRHGLPKLRTVSSSVTDIKNIPTRDYDLRDVPSNQEGNIPSALAAQLDEVVAETLQGRRLGRGVSAMQTIPTIEEEVEVKIEREDKDIGADKIPHVCRSAQYPISVCRSSAARAIPTIEEEAEVKIEKGDKEVGVDKIPHASRSAQYPLYVCRSSATRSITTIEEEVEMETKKEDKEVEVADVLRVSRSAQHPLSVCRSIPCRKQADTASRSVGDLDRALQPSREEQVQYERASCVCRNIQTDEELVDKEQSAPSFPMPPCRRASFDKNTICVDNVKDKRRLQKLKDLGKLSLDNVTCACKSGKNEICLPIARNAVSEGQIVHSAAPRRNVDHDQESAEFESASIHKIFSAHFTDVSLVCECTQTSVSQQSFEKATSEKINEDDSRKGAKYAISESGLRRICVDNSSREQQKLQELEDGVCVDPESDQRRLQALETKSTLESITCICKGAVKKVCTCDANTETGIAPCRTGLQDDRNAICVDNMHDLQMLQEMENLGTLSVENIISIRKGVQADVRTHRVSFEPRTKSETDKIVPPCRREIQGDRNAICIDSLDDKRRLQELEMRGILSLQNIICVCNDAQEDECLCTDASTSVDDRKAKIASSKTAKYIPPCRRELRGDKNAVCVDNIDDLQRLQALENQGTLSKNIICVCKGVQKDECLCKDAFTSVDDYEAKTASSKTAKYIPPCRRELRDDRNAVCVDNIEDQQRLQALENQGTLPESIICVCKGVQKDECLCEDAFTSADDHKAKTASSKTATYIPPCRRELRGDRNAVCVDNIEDQQRLQALENQGTMPESIICVCKGVQKDECLCQDAFTSADDHKTKTASFKTAKYIPPCRRELRGDRNAVCVDNIEDQQRLQALENQGTLPDNIICVCKGVQKDECLCKDAFTSVGDHKAKTASSKTSKYIPPCRRELRGDRNAVCVDNIVDQQRLQAMENQDTIPKNIICVCRGVQMDECLCKDSSSGDRNVICVDNIYDQQRLQDLEHEGLLSLENIVCVCKGVQADKCLCKESFISDDVKEAKSAPVMASRRRHRRPPQRRPSSIYSSSDTSEHQSQLQNLESEGILPLDTIQCVCQAVQAEVCKCADIATSPFNIKDPFSRRSVHLEESIVSAETQSSICDCRDSGTSPSQIEGVCICTHVQSVVSGEAPCRKELFSDTICVDNLEDKIRLQKLDDEGKLSLENIQCVCKGTHTEICVCSDTAVSVGSNVGDNIQCVCNGTQMVVCECKDTATSSPSLKEHLVKPISKETQSIKHDYEDTATVTPKEAQPYQSDGGVGKLPLDNIQCVCHGTQAEVCESRNIATSSVNLSKPPITVTRSAQSRKYESADATSLASAEGTSKFIQSESCQCVSKAASVASFEAPIPKETIKDQDIQGPPMPIEPVCVCKGVQHETCECKNVGTQKDDLEAQKELKDLKMQHNASSLENKALRKHASELKEVAKNQITSLSNELKKSRENWAITDDSKAMADLQAQNKLLQDEIERLKKLQCECSAEHKKLLEDEIERLKGLQCECSEKHKKDIEIIAEKIPLTEEQVEVIKNAGLSSEALSKIKPSEARVFSDQPTKILSKEIVVASYESKKAKSVDVSEKGEEKVETDLKDKKSFLTSSKEKLAKTSEKLIEPEKVIETAKTPKSSEVKRPYDAEDPSVPSDARKPIEKKVSDTGKQPEQAEISTAVQRAPSQKRLEQPSAIVTNADGTPKVTDYDKQPELLKVQSYIESKKPSEIKKFPSDVKVDDTKKEAEPATKLTDAPRESKRDPPKDRSRDDILGQQLKDCSEELDALRKQLADLKKQLADTKSDLEKERSVPKGDSSELDDLKKQLAALKNQLQEANAKLADCEQHLDDEKKKLVDEKKKSSVHLVEAKKQWEAEKEKQKPIKSASQTQTITVPTTTKGTETPPKTATAPQKDVIKPVDKPAVTPMASAVKDKVEIQSAIPTKQETPSAPAKPTTEPLTKDEPHDLKDQPTKQAKPTGGALDEQGLKPVAKLEEKHEEKKLVEKPFEKEPEKELEKKLEKKPEKEPEKEQPVKETPISTVTEPKDKPAADKGTKEQTVAQDLGTSAQPTGPVEAIDKKQPELKTTPPETSKKPVDKPVTEAGAADGAKGQPDLSDKIGAEKETKQERAVTDNAPRTTATIEKPVAKEPEPESAHQLAEKPYDDAKDTQPIEKQPGDYKQKYEQQKQTLKASKQKLNELQNELKKTKLQSIESLKTARSSYERDVASMQEKYLEGIASLQASHEELIKQGNSELEAEIDSLRKDSVEKQAKIDELQCICFEEKKKQPALCQAQVQSMDIQMECVCDDMLFAYLLRKILYCGLESLTFDDLQYLHTKICDATAKVMGSMQNGDTTFGPCSCDPRSRQTHAQTQVAKLQMEVALERQRLESLKQALEIERTTQAAMTQLFQRQVKYRHAVYPSYQANQIQTARSCTCPPENDVERDARYNSAI